MKTKLLLFATLLMSGICLAQLDPTRFTNTNGPNPTPVSPSFSFHVATEDGHPVGKPGYPECPSDSAGCVIYFSNLFSDPIITITLPDIPNEYVNHNTLACTITKSVITGTPGHCLTPKCQHITFTATGTNDGDSGDFSCRDADRRVWTLETTQDYHWLRVGRGYLRFYDGGRGTIRH